MCYLNLHVIFTLLFMTLAHVLSGFGVREIFFVRISFVPPSPHLRGYPPDQKLYASTRTFLLLPPPRGL